MRIQNRAENSRNHDISAKLAVQSLRNLFLKYVVESVTKGGSGRRVVRKFQLPPAFFIFRRPFLFRTGKQHGVQGRERQRGLEIEEQLKLYQASKSDKICPEIKGRQESTF